jgi:hypothetical protein
LTPQVTSARQAEWAAVEKELEADRQRRAEARKALGSGGQQEKSLYDVLQANKAAKQAAFEEAHRLKNQFRALDEDEIEFLEGVEADARREAARVAAETAAGLDAFRAAQTGKPLKEGGRGGGGDDQRDGDDDDPKVEKLVDDSAWAVAGRKRKRRGDKTGAFPNLKRKGSSAAAKDKESKGIEEAEAKKDAAPPPRTATETAKAVPAPAPAPAAAPRTNPALGLVAYGSDDDDDDDEDSD